MDKAADDHRFHQPPFQRQGLISYRAFYGTAL